MSDEDLFVALCLAAVCGGHNYAAVEVAQVVMVKIKTELEKMRNGNR